ncbi:hypothetical protein HPB52_015526 [Rhipicephalus sanguineus]|uniref:C2H2-type domain-containing protein n=1 Tax=Rhipicephalus sanguineus TaxID=34632 RepID=A0A9D4PRM2_RHISA|nr:hypothetical protein HPB52_015526 [Rhipicephalus sanguineus]
MATRRKVTSARCACTPPQVQPFCFGIYSYILASGHTAALSVESAFAIPETLRSHLTEKHPRKLPLHCERCKSDFRFRLELCQHEVVSSLETLHYCYYCGKGFLSSSDVLQHARTSHLPSRKHECDVCGRFFPTFESISIHSVFHLRHGVPYHQVAIGSKKYTKFHRKRRPHRCLFCPRHFLYLASLKRHQLTHKLENSSLCRICDRPFTLPCSVQVHLKEHEEELRLYAEELPHGIIPSEPPHECELCGKTYSTSNSLRAHRKTHSSDRPHKCDASTLRTHVKIHEQGGAASFACRLCGEAFAQAADLEAHSKIHLGELSPQPPEPALPFRCSICSKTFTRQTHLRNHMKLHLGPEPFKCEVCGQAFSQFSTLKSHLKAHMGEPSYSCSACGQHFLQFAALKAHMALHSNEKALVD